MAAAAVPSANRAAAASLVPRLDANELRGLRDRVWGTRRAKQGAQWKPGIQRTVFGVAATGDGRSPCRAARRATGRAAAAKRCCWRCAARRAKPNPRPAPVCTANYGLCNREGGSLTPLHHGRLEKAKGGACLASQAGAPWEATRAAGSGRACAHKRCCASHNKQARGLDAPLPSARQWRSAGAVNQSVLRHGEQSPRPGGHNVGARTRNQMRA